MERDLSQSNLCYLQMMRDIAEVSAGCGVRTYLWGGMALDVFEGRFLRDHGDLDGFTENLTSVWPRLAEGYTRLGYRTEFRSDISMLILRKNGCYACSSPLDRENGVAMWRHIGSGGTVYFPDVWLDGEPRRFYDVPVYTAGLCFEYAFRSIACLLNPQWKSRDKDREAKRRLQELLARKRVDPEDVTRRIWSYSPFFLRQGFDPFLPPVLVTPSGL